MKINYHKKLMYDYKYSDSVGIPQQIHHIKRVQRKHKKEAQINKISSLFRKRSFKKNTTVHIDYTEIEFLGV